VTREPVAERNGNLPDEVDRLLRGLPEWFGIEHSIRDYVEDARQLPTWSVCDPETGAIIGILLAKKHFPTAAEVHLMTVDRAWHRRGVGRSLLRAVEADLRADGVRFLQVKTLSSSRPDENYEKTRRFYLALGFAPLEEFLHLWDEGNPCLQLVKAL